MGNCCSCFGRRESSTVQSEYKPVASTEPVSTVVAAPLVIKAPDESASYQNPGFTSIQENKGSAQNITNSVSIQEIPVPVVAPSFSRSGIHPKSGFFLEYELREEIGLGSTSKCFRCERKSDGKEFACKVIDKRQIDPKSTSLLDQFFVEIKVLKSLNHPNIIKLEDTFETADRIYVVMELMKGGELFDYVVEKGTLSEEEASTIIRKITSAVAHMHGLDIIHRDLKPENLLLTKKGQDAEVKIIDFGLAKIMEEDVTRSFLGTRGYLAPEMLQRHHYDKAVDVWALGVIAFVLLCGCLPFDDDSSRIASEQAARKKFTLRFPRWAATLSASAKDLLHNLLDVNPKTRFTAEQALNHPWVTGRTVQPNSYLQSPSILSSRKSSVRSPVTPNRLAMQNRLAQAQAQAAQQQQQQLQLQQQPKPPTTSSNGRVNVGTAVVGNRGPIPVTANSTNKSGNNATSGGGLSAALAAANKASTPAVVGSSEPDNAVASAKGVARDDGQGRSRKNSI